MLYINSDEGLQISIIFECNYSAMQHATTVCGRHDPDAAYVVQRTQCTVSNSIITPQTL